MAPSTVSAQLKRLRQRAGYTVRAIAMAMNDASPSSYYGYERAYKHPFMPMVWVQRLLPVLVGRGDPPITAEEVLALAGFPLDPPPEPDARPPVERPPTPTESRIEGGTPETTLFAQRLRHLREETAKALRVANLAPAEFAERIGVPAVSYSQYEGGESDPPIWVLVAIRRVTGVSLDALIGSGPGDQVAEIETPPRDYGVRLKTARLALRLSVEVAAAQSKIDPDLFQKFERELEVPTIENLLKINRGLGIPIDFVMTGDYSALTGRMMQLMVNLGAAPDAPEPARELRTTLPRPKKPSTHTLHEQQARPRGRTVSLPDE